MDQIWEKLFETAKKAPLIGPSRHAAALIYKNEIMSIGIAQQKSHPLMKKFSNNDKTIYLHAEMDAIIRGINEYGEDFIGRCSLRVVRISRGGFVRLSKPCPICQKAIEAFGIQQVEWTK